MNSRKISRNTHSSPLGADNIGPPQFYTFIFTLAKPRLRQQAVSNLAHFDFDIVSDFDIRISDFKLAPSTTVERALQITLFCAKQTQFPQPQNQHKSLPHNNLPQSPAPPHATEQSQFKPNPPLAQTANLAQIHQEFSARRTRLPHGGDTKPNPIHHGQ